MPAVLAQLGDIDKLYDLARDKHSSARADLAKTIGSILEAEVSPRESELIADVLIELTRQAEKDLRQALSEQISTIDGAPLRLVLQLANDEIEIATPVLMNSRVLGGVDLIYIIKSKPSEYWRTIAARSILEDNVIDVLADTQDFETALTLAENTSIKLTEHALTVLSDTAQDSELLALPLLRRPEVSREIAARLYEYVGNEIKEFINNNYDRKNRRIDKVIDQAVQEFAAPGPPQNFLPDDYMLSTAQNFKERDMLNTKLMLSALRRGHIRSFIAQFSVYTGLSVQTVGQILSQTHGQGLAVAAKAFGIEKHDFISMFMLSSKIWNSRSFIEIEEIKMAIEYYRKVTPELAMEIIKGKKNQ